MPVLERDCNHLPIVGIASFLEFGLSSQRFVLSDRIQN